MAVLFFSYSHKDEKLRDALEVHLSLLKRQNIIETWHDRRIGAGTELKNRISEELERADVILLLVSPDLIASDYCYDKEMTRVMERHNAKEARVIPVILRPCDWHGAPFGQLMAVPKDGKPISKWPDVDEAFLDVVKAIREAVGELGKGPSHDAPPPGMKHDVAHSQAGPRSSNLRTRKQFNDIDRDRFLDDAYQFMVKFFEGSLKELEQRNQGLQTTFRINDADTFTAVIYEDGKSVSECRIHRGGPFGDGITYSSDTSRQTNSYNEQLRVEADDQKLFLKALGMGRVDSADAKLTFEGAAELYWGMLIRPLQ